MVFCVYHLNNRGKSALVSVSGTFLPQIIERILLRFVGKGV